MILTIRIECEESLHLEYLLCSVADQNWYLWNDNRGWKKVHTSMANLFLTKLPKQFSGI